MHGPTDLEWAAKLKADIDGGKLTFADAARDNSDRPRPRRAATSAGSARASSTEAVEKAIFAAPIGKVSDPLVVDGDGIYLFLVDKEETRTPDADQKAALENSAFSTGTPSRRRPRRSPATSNPVPSHGLTPAGAGGTMLDALLAEARLRWGLDPAAGLAVVVAERAGRDAHRAVACRCSSSRPRGSRSPTAGDAPRAAARPPRPGRRATPSPSCAGCTRRTTRSAGSGAPDGTTVGALDRGRPRRRRSTSRRSRPSPTPPRRGACPGSRTGSGRPTAARGTASRPTSRCATTSSRRRTRSTTRSRPARRRSSPASSATCCSRSSSTRSSPPRRACST